jgi:D-glycerate 3-kinase
MVNTTTYSNFIEQERLSSAYLEQAAEYFDPVVLGLVEMVSSTARTVFVSLVGCQGSGKTTLSKYLDIRLSEMGVNTLVLSLDDFYLSHSARSELSKSIHPLLKTRGVPGTHDVELLSRTLNELKRAGCIDVTPCFDKASDDRRPEAEWARHSERFDIVILEGWCWGAHHVNEAALERPVNSLERNEDANGDWRHYVNEHLKNDYEPLYSMFDIKLFLKAPSFDTVYSWRLEQENKLKQGSNNSNNKESRIMSSEQISNFIQYYERITNQLLDEPDSNWDVVWHLNARREITKVTLGESLLSDGQANEA